MSSRSRSRSTSSRAAASARPALPLALCIAIAAAVAGCTAFDVFRGEPAPAPAAAAAPSSPAAKLAPVAPAAPAAPSRISFDHKFHLGRGPTCDDCHEGADKADKAPMPNMEFCANCHEEIDAKKPKERTLAAFLDKDGKTPLWSHVTAQSADIVFSHKTHAEKKVACAECHRGIETATSVTKDLFVDMDTCTKCHESKKAKTDCATCHRQSAKNVAEGKGPYWAPANHQAPAWRGAHGAIARAGQPRNRAEDCALCHGREQFPQRGSCDTCHAATKPASHDAAWRGLHGQTVRKDPSVRAEHCDVCHAKPGFPESGACNVCHVTTKPASHDRAWTALHGQTVRREPSSPTERCAFCHDAQGFPRESKCTGCHLTEPPRDHTQSWRVGGGHGLAAALDRTRCDACHTPDTCATCHATVSPRSHRGLWGAPRDRHCVGCHLPLQKDSPDGCGMCHQGTPSHAAAPRMPSEPPHRPDSQCRICHFKLRHADNGTNCVTCHR